MNIQEAIQRIKASGLTIEHHNGKLVIKPAGKMSEKQREWIKVNREAIIKELRGPYQIPSVIHHLAEELSAAYGVAKEACLAILDEGDMQAIAENTDPSRYEAWGMAVKEARP